MKYMSRLLRLGAALLPLLASAQNTGSAPETSLDVPDVYAAFGLPTLQDQPDGPLASAFQTQAGSRARRLGLSGHSARDAWTAAQALLQTALANQPPSSAAPLVFSDLTASALNRVLAGGATASVRVAASALTVDEPVKISRAGITLDLGMARLTSANPQPYMLRIEGANGVTVRGGEFAAGDSAILISACDRVSVEDVVVHDLKGSGIIVTNSTHVLLRRNQFTRLSAAAIVLHRATSSSVAAYNEITGGLGASNMNAGIVLSDREVDMSAGPRAFLGPDGYWVISQQMSQRANPPHDNLIAYNRITANTASGIYVDGAVRNVIVSNTIDGNAKEGLCLDNGATANVVASNNFLHNGNRWGQSDWVLQQDYAMAGGRLPDGTSAVKVPGISLDNAMYNIVFANAVTHNFGGGIKIVRTGFFNLIGLNTLLSNNDGASSGYHFFGIELGAAAGDAPSGELDFTPSRGNIVFSNPVRGNHYSGIFFDAGSDQNDVLDNVILDAQAWALESVQTQANRPLNNLTTLPSRNIDTGLDPALVGIGRRHGR
jgi:parallel beta-helix repeat protein